MPKVVCFLQNMWFKDPERMKVNLEVSFKGNREAFIATWLFWSCLTGKRLRSCFGQDTCDEITWEEQSPEIGGHASAAFPADCEHIKRVLDKHNPTHVIALGKSASAALAKIHGEVVKKWIMKQEPYPRPWTLLDGPHPAARQGDVIARLKAIGETIQALLAPIAQVDAFWDDKTKVHQSREP